MPELHYETVLIPGWAEEVAGWNWDEVGDNAWRKGGSCPRCGHEMTIDYTVTAAIGFFPPRKAPKLRSPLARCNCEHSHPERPDGPYPASGCGQAASIPPPTVK